MSWWASCIRIKLLNLFKMKISFLWRLISEQGYTMEPPPQKYWINNIKDWKKKKIFFSELSNLIGLVGNFKNSISNFIELVKPLYLLLKDKDLERKSKQHKECFYNDFHNIVRVFDVLRNFLFTRSETICDYYFTNMV